MLSLTSALTKLPQETKNSLASLLSAGCDNFMSTNISSPCNTLSWADEMDLVDAMQHHEGENPIPDNNGPKVTAGPQHPSVLIEDVSNKDDPSLRAKTALLKVCNPLISFYSLCSISLSCTALHCHALPYTALYQCCFIPLFHASALFHFLFHQSAVSLSSLHIPVSCSVQ
jgi:hypothetical protein